MTVPDRMTRPCGYLTLFHAGNLTEVYLTHKVNLATGGVAAYTLATPAGSMWQNYSLQ